jgi:import receptor subunit TOM70
MCEKIENGSTIFILVLDHCFLFTEVQRGNLKRAIELFDKAIPLTNTELEMAHLFGLRDAAIAQINVSTKLGISLPSLGLMG